MGGYWTRAIERFNGELFSVNQWVIWPPLYHILLCDIFKVIDFVGYFQYNLEIVLVIQIFLCSCSVFFLYKVSFAIFKNPLISLLIASTYAFSFILIYFKSFILTENVSIPLLIFSIWLLFQNRVSCLVLCGIFLAIAAGIRPGTGLLGLPCALYILFGKDRLRTRIRDCAVYAICFFAVIFLILAENNYISRGRVRGLSASSGITFFFSFTRAHAVQSSFDGYMYIIYPPSTCDKPQNGKMETSVPIYNSDYFMNLGIDYIKSNPSILYKKIADDVKELFFGPLMPSMNDSMWFVPLKKPVQWTYLVMSVFSLPVWICFRNRAVDRRKLLFMLSIPALSVVVTYFFNTEQRYLYSFAFVIHLAFFAVLFEIAGDFKRYKAFLFVFSSSALLLGGTVFFINKCNAAPDDKKVKAIITQNDAGITSLYQQKNAVRQDSVLIDVIEFSPSEHRLIHRKLEELNYDINFFIDFYSDFTVLVPGEYEFIIDSVNADDCFDMEIDNRPVIAMPLAPSEKTSSRTRFTLDKGAHHLKISYFKGNNQSGIVVYYKPPGSLSELQYLIGSDSRYITFKNLQ